VTIGDIPSHAAAAKRHVLAYVRLLIEVAGAFKSHRPYRTRDYCRAKKAGRGWHHHSRALRRQSMGQGDDRLPGKRRGLENRSRDHKLFFEHG
jgi:hypothetical protein